MQEDEPAWCDCRRYCFLRLLLLWLTLSGNPSEGFPEIPSRVVKIRRHEGARAVATTLDNGEPTKLETWKRFSLSVSTQMLALTGCSLSLDQNHHLATKHDRWLRHRVCLFSLHPGSKSAATHIDG